ncbi:related to GPI18 - mannosyltransferase [Ustilago trichophora]|uniref:GPI mannosyltransferase 2 n=1 Tax=Ustilago trichophora TaxID=86804 RepID=A0A5C3EHA5_9BASI|nr:related to GPI18 - mannosyltransferase [Ustilago trichophora]
MLTRRRIPPSEEKQDVDSPHSKVATLGPTARKLSIAQSRILKLSLVVRFLSITLLILSSHLQQAFDTSHTLLSYSLDPLTSHGLSSGSFNWLLAFVRWDTIYFLSSAAPTSLNTIHTGGYEWEQTLAFQPGIIALLRGSGFVTPEMDGRWSPTTAVLFTTLFGNGLAVAGPVLLHRLAWKLTRNLELSYTAAVLSIFAPSAGTTLTAATPESCFSFACLMGLLALESGTKCALGWVQVMEASFWFSVATVFRSNGTLLVGYLGFKLLREKTVTAIVKLTLLTAVCIAPSVGFQLWAYTRFCLADDTRPWCQSSPPSIYAFVQSHYWNVGFLRYWELAQMPNFLLASPVLVGIAYTVYTFYGDSSFFHIIASVNPLTSTTSVIPSTTNVKSGGLSLSSSPAATPYIIHSLALGLLLLFASHIQIALRFATPGGIPAIWLGAAHAVLCGKPWLRRFLVAYLAVQYVLAIGLYAGFYPPA